MTHEFDEPNYIIISTLTLIILLVHSLMGFGFMRTHKVTTDWHRIPGMDVSRVYLLRVQPPDNINASRTELNGYDSTDHLKERKAYQIHTHLNRPSFSPTSSPANTQSTSATYPLSA